VPTNITKDIEAKFPGCRPLSKESFLHYIADCANVEAVEASGLEALERLQEPVALFFYNNRPARAAELTEQLKVLGDKLGAGGIAVGNDFTPVAPEVILGVNKLAAVWGAKPEVIGRVWAISKPGAGDEPMTVYDRAGPYTDYDLSVSIKLKSGEVIKHTPGSWAGSLDKWNPIVGMMADWSVPRKDGLSGAYQVIGLGTKTSNWAAFGQWAEMNGPIGGMRAHLIGAGSAGLRLGYQVSYLVEHRGKRVITRGSKIFRDGGWVADDASIKAPGISALRCFVEERAGP